MTKQSSVFKGSIELFIGIQTKKKENNKLSEFPLFNIKPQL